MECGRVAQLVEQRPFKAWVAGSNPAALTISFCRCVPNRALPAAGAFSACRPARVCWAAVHDHIAFHVRELFFMSNLDAQEPKPPSDSAAEPQESFKDLLSQYEQSHSHKAEEGSKRLEATVVTLTADSILLDIGFKTEGILPLAALPKGETVKPGNKLLVTVKGRDPEGYYEVALGKISRPTDWASLEQAYNEKASMVGTVM